MAANWTPVLGFKAEFNREARSVRVNTFFTRWRFRGKAVIEWPNECIADGFLPNDERSQESEHDIVA
jgi:hypothetical protein